MAQVIDTAGEEVLPYLIHLSGEGIAPRIEDVPFQNAVEMVEVEGERLGTLLDIADGVEYLEDIYRELGEKVGYLSRLPVVHTDLHVNNVVVAYGDDTYGEDSPLIIDWDRAGWSGLVEADDSSEVLESSRERLESGSRAKWYGPLHESFMEGYREGNRREPDIDVAGLQERYYRLLVG